MSRQTVCDQCGGVVQEGYRIKMSAMFRKVIHTSRGQEYQNERRRLDFCGRECLVTFVDEHEEMR